MDRRPVTDRLAARGGRIGVEHGGEEDRRALGVEVEDLGRIGREPEAVLASPTGRRRRDPPRRTVTSSASMRTFMSSSADPAPRRRRAHAVELEDCGSVSRTRRWSVQSPPFSTLDGIPGSGVSDPNAPPPPANWKAVM